MSIYIQVTKQYGKYIYKDTSAEDLIKIGVAHDPSNSSSLFAVLELFYARRFDDGRVYIINGNRAWVLLTVHGKGNTECIGFALTFTQRIQPGNCVKSISK